jgi:hypothetical protein
MVKINENSTKKGVESEIDHILQIDNIVLSGILEIMIHMPGGIVPDDQKGMGQMPPYLGF